MLGGFNGALHEAAEKLSKLKDRALQFTQAVQQKEKTMRKCENSLRDI